MWTMASASSGPDCSTASDWKESRSCPVWNSTFLQPDISDTVRILIQVLLAVALIGDTAALHAASLVATLTDQDGKPVDDAVVYVRAIDGVAPPVTPLKVTIDQVDEMFVPHVRAVTAGSEVSFPNSDHVHHHVYSFSEARTFEVPLYIGVPASPIVFDKAGLVTLGCNIHDHMLGYVLVLDTPYFSEISDGNGHIENLPAGEWALEVWHPRLKDSQNITRTMTASANGEAVLSLRVELVPERIGRRAPRRGGARY